MHTPNRPVAQPNKAHIPKYICVICKRYLSKLQTIFVKIAKYICLNNQIYLSKEKIRKEMGQQGCTRQTGPWHSLMKPPGPEWSHQQVMYIPLHCWVRQVYICVVSRCFTLFYIVYALCYVSLATYHITLHLNMSCFFLLFI